MATSHIQTQVPKGTQICLHYAHMAVNCVSVPNPQTILSYYLLLSLWYHATTAERELCHSLHSEPASVRVGRLFNGFSLTVVGIWLPWCAFKGKAFSFHEMCLNNIIEVFSSEVSQRTLDFSQPNIKPRLKSVWASRISAQIEKPEAINQTEQKSRKRRWCLFSNLWQVHSQSARLA